MPIKSFLTKALNSSRFRMPRLMAKISGEWPLVPAQEISRKSLSEWSGVIPNHVYQTWDQNLFGKTHASGLSNFRDLNQDFHFHFFDGKAMDEYMSEYYANHPIKDVYFGAQYGAMKVDIWRYCILCERGGLYFDINKGLSIPIREILSPTDHALISYESNLLKDVRATDPNALLPLVFPEAARKLIAYDDRPVLNWGFAFEKQHPFLVKTINNIAKNADHYKGKVFVRARDAILELTTYMLMRSIYQCLEENPDIPFTQAGIDFNGYGIPNMPGSWVRFASKRSYVRAKNCMILK